MLWPSSLPSLSYLSLARRDWISVLDTHLTSTADGWWTRSREIRKISTKSGPPREVKTGPKEKHSMNLPMKINTEKVENRTDFCLSCWVLFLGTPTKKHSLELPFTGSANVVFNGSFFYYNEDKESIVKLDLATKDQRCLQIPTGRQKLKVENGHIWN